MNLFNALFGKFFSSKKVNTESGYNQQAQWKGEQKERKESIESRLKAWIINLVREKNVLEFSWESGNDEAFLTFKDFKEEDADNFCELEEYIIDKLEIPDAGEFQMNGNGTIYISDNLVKAKYSSTMKAVIDFDEETEQEIFSEEEQDNGDRVLFTI